MREAVALARTQLGRTAPNPAVGCVIVRNGAIVGRGATGPGGRPHAEEVALMEAGQAASGAIAYVTLEPCHSRSSGAPGCSDRLIDAGVARVVAAMEDPHPTAMDGFAKLRAAGVKVEVGLCADEARVLVEGFFHRLDTGRPLLVIDPDPTDYDAVFVMKPGESPEQALDRLGAEGLTRVSLDPYAEIAAQLRARGLVDRETGD